MNDHSPAPEQSERLPHVGSGAAAIGHSAMAAGERGVVAAGNVAGPIVTGDQNLIIGDMGSALQNQALQQSLQALLAQAFSTVERPQLEDLFHIVRDPPDVAVAFFASARGLPFQPFDIPYQSPEGAAWQPAQDAFGIARALLLRGRPGSGRTRAAAELARDFCARGWTVCLARLENCRKMGAPAGLLPDRRLLFIVDDLPRHARPSGDGARTEPYLQRLAACLQLFEQDPEVDLLLLLSGDVLPPPDNLPAGALWRDLAALDLPELTAQALQTILQDAAQLGGVPADPVQLPELVAASDGTPKTMVANVTHAALTGQPLSAAVWHNTWRGTWQDAFRQARDRDPRAVEVFKALHLLQSTGLPARLPYVYILGRSLGQAPGRTQDGQDVDTAVQTLLARGLLRADDHALAPFAADQIEVSLQSVQQELPSLHESWPVLLQSLQDASETLAVSDALADLTTLTAALNDRDLYPAAETVATVALDRDPGHGAAAYQRGLARAQQDDYEGAVADFSLAHDAAYRPAATALMRGLSRFMLADYDAAVVDFDEAIAGGELLGYKGRGLAHIFRQEFDAALPDLEEAQASAPDDGALHYLRGMAHYALEDEAASLLAYSRAIENGFDNAAAYFARGWLNWKRQNWAAADEDFSHVLEAAPGAFLYLMRGMARHHLGRLSDAEADLSLSITHWQEDDYLNLLHTIARALHEDERPLATLLEEHPDWIRRLMLALPGAELPPQLSSGALAGVARFWANFMEKQLAGQNVPFGSFAQMSSMPYIARGFVRLDAGNFQGAAADFDAAGGLGASPALTLYGLGAARLGLGAVRDAVQLISEAIDHGQNAAQAFYWRAVSLVALEDPHAAIADFTVALTRGMDEARVYRQRAQAYVAVNWLQAAESDLTRAIERSGDPVLPFMRGAVRFDQSDFAGAEADFDDAAARGYDAAALFSLRGWSRFRQENYHGALSDFDAALGREAQDARFHYGKAAAHFNLGQYAAAEAAYGEAIDRGFEDPHVYLERALARIELDDLIGAVGDARAALDRGLNDPRLYYVLGRGRLQQGDFAAAEASLTRALEAGLDDGQLYMYRARARAAQGNFAGAVADCDATLARGESLFTVWLRGVSRFELGEYSAALPDLSATRDDGTSDSDVLLCRAQAHYFLGQYDDAASAAAQLLTAEPDNAFAWQLRASAQAHMGELSEAQAALEWAQQLAPDDPINHDVQAELALARRDLAQALARYESILRHEPGSLGHFNLGLVRILAGQIDEGLKSYEAGLPGATALDLLLARQELDHWPTQIEVTLSTGQKEALQRARQQLDAAAAS